MKSQPLCEECWGAICQLFISTCPLSSLLLFQLPTAEKPPDPFRQAIALLIDTSSPIPWLFAALCWHRYVCHVPGLHKMTGGRRWETVGVCKVTNMEMSAIPSLAFTWLMPPIINYDTIFIYSYPLVSWGPGSRTAYLIPKYPGFLSPLIILGTCMFWRITDMEGWLWYKSFSEKVGSQGEFIRR